MPWYIHLPLAVGAGFVGGALWASSPESSRPDNGRPRVIVTIMLNYVAYNLDRLGAPYRARPARGAIRTRSRRSSIRRPQLVPIINGLAPRTGRRRSRWPRRSWCGGSSSARRRARVARRRLQPARGAMGHEHLVVDRVLDGHRRRPGRPGGAAVILSGSAHPLAGLRRRIRLDGIVVALVATPGQLGVVAAALLFGSLRAARRRCRPRPVRPLDLVVIIQALVILFIAAPSLVRSIYRIRSRRTTGTEVFAEGGSMTAVAMPITRSGRRIRRPAVLVSDFGRDGHGHRLRAWRGAGDTSTFTLTRTGRHHSCRTSSFRGDDGVPRRRRRRLRRGGAAQRGSAHDGRLVLGLVAFLFVVAFLTWVAAGQSMNLTGVLQTTVQLLRPGSCSAPSRACAASGPAWSTSPSRACSCRGPSSGSSSPAPSTTRGWESRRPILVGALLALLLARRSPSGTGSTRSSPDSSSTSSPPG